MKLTVPQAEVKLVVPQAEVKLTVPQAEVKLVVPQAEVKLAVPQAEVKLAVPTGVQPCLSADFEVPWGVKVLFKALILPSISSLHLSW